MFISKILIIDFLNFFSVLFVKYMSVYKFQFSEIFVKSRIKHVINDELKKTEVFLKIYFLHKIGRLFLSSCQIRVNMSLLYDKSFKFLSTLLLELWLNWLNYQNRFKESHVYEKLCSLTSFIGNFFSCFEKLLRGAKINSQNTIYVRFLIYGFSGWNFWTKRKVSKSF